MTARKTLEQLVAHVRTFGMFIQSTDAVLYDGYSYAPIISLHHAHLAQLIGDYERAKACYDAATSLTKSECLTAIAQQDKDKRGTQGRAQTQALHFIHCSAVLGLIALEVGQCHPNQAMAKERRGWFDRIKSIGNGGMLSSQDDAGDIGSTIRSMVGIILASLTEEILTAKLVCCSFCLLLPF